MTDASTHIYIYIYIYYSVAVQIEIYIYIYITTPASLLSSTVKLSDHFYMYIYIYIAPPKFSYKMNSPDHCLVQTVYVNKLIVP